MLRFIGQQLLHGAAVLLIASLIIFVGLYVIGNPVDVLLAGDATQLDRDHAIRSLGLDRSLPEQYLTFFWNLAHGDLGRSFVYNQPAVELILQRLPATLELAFTALLLALAIGIPIGTLAGLRPGSLFDQTVMIISVVCYSLPTFWSGMILIMIFAVLLDWLPSVGRGEIGTTFGIPTSFASWSGISHLVLPALNLALFKIALIIRLTRSGVRETMLLDFVRTARAMGLNERQIVLRHVLRNSFIPIITVIGIEFGSLIAFSVVTESIFGWPGIGKLLINSIQHLDRPVVVAYLVLSVALFVVINLVVDILASALDPRIRLGRV